MKRLSELSPRALVWLLCGVWWVVNLLQAAFTELANDEAYYYIFSLKPAWGYFDHPPVTAWLVWLGTKLFGATAFGVRFFFTLLLPGCLLLFHRVARPEGETRRDAVNFLLIASALPILQLYGWLAVPDGPLLFATALFFLCYKWFTDRDNLGSALLLGLSIALLAYSKYHGALVVLLTLLSNLRLLRNPRLWLAGAVALGLLVPHLMWQADHDWASFTYHLAGRNKAFKFNYITEYILNILVVFNPFFFLLYIRAWRHSRRMDAASRAVDWTGAGVILFFLASAFRGYVQPQWAIVAAFMFIGLLWHYVRNFPRSLRYVRTVIWATLGVIGLIRLVAVFNPFGVGGKLYYEIFNNRASYGAIAEKAAGRPVIFRGNYAIAAKYIFYTGGEAYCQPNLYYRTSQWQFLEWDTKMEGREVIAEVWEGVQDSLRLANGKMFRYSAVPDFHPVRHVRFQAQAPVPQQVKRGQEVAFPVSVANPYPYAIAVCPGSSTRAVIVFSRHARRQFSEYDLSFAMDIPDHTLAEGTVSFTVPGELEPGEYNVGLAVRHDPVGYWYNSPVWRVEVE